jgi:DNA-binding CsgD family transcriptional regulator
MPQDIIGRDAELDAVERFLSAVGERPAALLLEGEAGVGKTTVWREAVAAANARGLRVLQARPAESEAALSYAALADLIGAVFEETRADLPEPQQRALDVVLLRGDGGGRAHPRTTATALVGVLTALAAERPTVVAIDDVQWLDRASERALAFAARRLPPKSGLLLTCRSDGDGTAPLGLNRAQPDQLLETVVVGPLSLAALHHVLASRIGKPPPRPLLVRIAAASGGNPFFALEIARALEREGGQRALDDPLPVTRGLHELVAARMRALSRQAREAIVTVSMLSRPTVAGVAAALGSGDGLHAGLVEAEEAGVLVSEHDRLRFSHPLLASVIHGSVSAQRRRQLHRRLAEVATDAEERAHHLARSTTEPDEDVAAELERAAERATGRGAQDAAAELYEASSRLTPPDRADEVARRTAGAASALFAAGDLARARSLAERVAATAEHGHVRAESRLLLADIAWVDETAQAAAEHLERALPEAGDDRVLRGRIHAALASQLLRLDDEHAAQLDAAMTLLDEEQHAALLAKLLFGKFIVELHLGRGARLDLFERGLEMEARAHLVGATPSCPGLHFQSIDAFDAARARFQLEDKWCREHGEEGARARGLAHLATVELRAGRWELAERYIEESCSAMEQIARRGLWSVPLRIRALVDAHRGRFPRARSTLLPLIEETERRQDRWWAAGYLSTLGFVEFAAGADAAADTAWTRMAEHVAALGVKEHARDRSEPDHIEALLTLGGTERARRLLDHLECRGRTWPRLWIDAALPRARALVVAAEGDVAAALATLDEAPEIGELPFELARTLLAKGRLHRRVKQKRAAADALQRALEIFEQLGSPPWIERTRAELARVGLRPASRWELTETERRVAELAAAGRTNREVAQQLFMSPKTVEANLARVYRKLGIRSRAELGARIAARA